MKSDTSVCVGILTFQIRIPEALSLKEKRRVLKSLKDRIRSGYSVSVAEIGHFDKWQIATVGVAMIGHERPYVDATLQKIGHFLQAQGFFELLDYHIEFV